MKYCTGCETAKDESEFWINQSRCKECRRAYDKERYQTRYKQKRLESVEDWKKRQLALIRNLKEGTPCADCKAQYHWSVMQFDHLPGFEKDGCVGEMALRVSAQRLEEEIAKCEIVCANCHFYRTYLRRSGDNG